MIFAKKSAEELHETWQIRAMIAASGKLQSVLLISLAKEFPSDLLLLLTVAFGTVEIPMPF